MVTYKWQQTFVLLTNLIVMVTSRHIVFIVIDDLGWNDIGFHNPDIISPNVDRLAREGLILNQAYALPACSPSRTAFMTAYYPYRLGLQHDAIMPQQDVCVPHNITFLSKKMKRLGYATHIVGKWHLGFCSWRCTPTFRGFDSFLGFYNYQQDFFSKKVDNFFDFRDGRRISVKGKGRYSTFVFQERVLQILSAHNPRKPLFLYLPLQSVHSPLEVPMEYYDMYPHVHNENRRIFSGMVTAMDDVIGNLTLKLKERGMYNDTLFIFTSDNGGGPKYNGNNYPLRGGKFTLWEGGTRVVAFVHGSGLQVTGTRYEGMMHAVDWTPTIVAAAGGKIKDPEIDGISMWEAISTGSASPRSEFVYNIDDVFLPNAGYAGIRQGDYKLLIGLPGSYGGWYTPDQSYNESEWLVDEVSFLARVNKNSSTGITEWEKEVQLFNIFDDPTERVNLASTMPDIVNRLRTRLYEYKQKYVPPHYPMNNSAANPDHYYGVWTPGWC